MIGSMLLSEKEKQHGSSHCFQDFLCIRVSEVCSAFSARSYTIVHRSLVCLQAAGRVWRDGQKKRVFVYRLLSTGTIEENVYQRQLSKEGLQTVVNSDEKGGGSAVMSSEELR